MQDRYMRDGNTPLIQACHNNDYTVAVVLTETDAMKTVNETNRFGTSPLICACMHGDEGFALVKLLVSRGAKVNYASGVIRNGTYYYGETPLMVAVSNDCGLEMFNYLLERTNNEFLNITDRWCETVLKVVRDHKNDVFEELLLARGAREISFAQLLTINPTVNRSAPVFGQGAQQVLTHAEIGKEMGFDEMEEAMESLPKSRATSM